MIGPTWPPAAGAPALRPLQVLSLMSGTSLDGMDLVVAALSAPDGALAWEIRSRVAVPYPSALRARLVDALDEGVADLRELTQLHAEIGEAYASACGAVCDATAVDLVALSGQNVYHVPRTDRERGWRTVATLQLGEAARVLERCRVPVASDFRQSDMAAGGQGAPMVSFGDLMLFGGTGRARAVHNLGGISNLTWLPPDGDPSRVVAFDTGPASCLLDEAAERHFGRPFDQGGEKAARGRVDPDALAALMRHPYLALPFPKTTGREVFALDRIDAELGAGLDRLEPHDLMATLCAFTADGIARAYALLGADRPLDEVLLAGGGAANATMVRMLRERLPAPVRTFEELGMHAKDREALAFAVMAYYGFHGLPSTVPAATGARRAVVAGKFQWPGPG